jgi:hypothetical protein
MRRALLSGVAAAVAAAAGAEGVRYEARLDSQDRIFVDVENAGSVSIRVTSMTVLFQDARGAAVARRTLDCERDCTVAPESRESFGPIDAPRAWETVTATQVLYRELGPRPATEPPAAPSARPSLRPSAAPSAAPARDVNRGSPEALLRAFYVALNRGDLARARQLCTPSAIQGWSGAGGDDAFAKAETREGTVMDVRLVALPLDANPVATVEVSFADGAKARRRIALVREGEGFRVDKVERAP